MSHKLSRRALIISGAALLVGCKMRGSSSTIDQPRPPVAELKPALPIPAGGQWYVVVVGDTFVGISRRGGIELGDLLAANPTIDARMLKQGTKLWLPSATPAQVQRIIATRPRPGETDASPGDEERPVAGKGYVLVPRAAWTQQPVGANHNLMNGVTRITVHHTGEHAGLADLPTVEILKRIERYHREERKWCAIGYHYIVGHEGRIYEGRPTKYQGAHVLSENEHNIGISVAGDFMRKLPSPRQLAALKAFLNDARTKYSVAMARVYGHRDLNRSDCPGDALYAWLKTYKRG